MLVIYSYDHGFHKYTHNVEYKGSEIPYLFRFINPSESRWLVPGTLYSDD